MTPKLSILLLCPAERAEFADARAAIAASGGVRELTDLDSAAAALRAGEVGPDVIVVAQAFPGQFSHEAIDRLRRLAPLARVVGLMGSWCEGEMRTGSPWPARCGPIGTSGRPAATGNWAASPRDSRPHGRCR